MFFDGLIAAEGANSEKARMFDAPPLGKLLPALVDVASQCVSAVRNKELTAEEAIARIYREASDCR